MSAIQRYTIIRRYTQLSQCNLNIVIHVSGDEGGETVQTYWLHDMKCSFLIIVHSHHRDNPSAHLPNAAWSMSLCCATFHYVHTKYVCRVNASVLVASAHQRFSDSKKVHFCRWRIQEKRVHWMDAIFYTYNIIFCIMFSIFH